MVTSSLLFSNHFIHPFVPIKVLSLSVLVTTMAIISLPGILRIKWHNIDGLLMTWLIWQTTTVILLSEWSHVVAGSERPILLLLFYLILRSVNVNNFRFDPVAWTISAIALIQASIGLLQYFDLFPWTSNLYQGFETRVTGTVGGANVLGGLLAVSLPFVYYCVAKSVREWRLLWIIAFVIIFIALILTKSRGAWIAGFAGLVVYYGSFLAGLFKSMWIKRWTLLIATPIVLLALSLSFAAIYNLNSASADGRLFIWSVTWDMIQDHFITGVGYGNFGLHWLDYQGAYFAQDLSGKSHSLAVSLTSAHSQYMQILAETGIVGLLIFFGFIATLLFNVRRKFRTLVHVDSQFLVVLISALFTLLIHGIVEDVLVGLPLEIIFFLIIAMLALMISESSLKNKGCQPYKFFWMQILFVPVFVLSIRSGYQEVRGELLWKQGRELAQVGMWEQGIEKYKKASEFLPDNSELEFCLGAAYAKIGQARHAIQHLSASKKGFIDKNQFIALGKAYLDNGDYDHAEKSLRQVLRYYPKLLSPHFWLSRVYFEQGYIERAREELKFIVNADNALNSSKIEMVKNDARRALAALERVIYEE